MLIIHSIIIFSFDKARVPALFSCLTYTGMHLCNLFIFNYKLNMKNTETVLQKIVNL